MHEAYLCKPYAASRLGGIETLTNAIDFQGTVWRYCDHSIMPSIEITHYNGIILEPGNRTPES